MIIFRINWPLNNIEPIISEKDANLPFWDDIKNKTIYNVK